MPVSIFIVVGFPRAVGSDERHYLALGHPKGNILYRFDALILRAHHDLRLSFMPSPRLLF